MTQPTKAQPASKPAKPVQKSPAPVEEVKEVKQPEQTPAPVEEVKEEVAASVPVNPVTYNRFTDLKFLQISGAPLTKIQKEELADLEKELKACIGKKPVRTVRAAIQNEQALLVTGIPVPASIETLIGEKHSLYYFGEQS